MIETWKLIAILAGLMGAGLGAMTLYAVQQSLRRGKTYLIALNSNSKAATVYFTKLKDREVWQPNPDLTVKLEGDYCYISKTGHRVFVYNEDTGKLLKAREGEFEELDGSVLAKYLGNRFIERIAVAGGGVNWAMIAAIVGCVVLVGLIVLGVVVSKALGGVDGAS